MRSLPPRPAAPQRITPSDVKSLASSVTLFQQEYPLTFDFLSKRIHVVTDCHTGHPSKHCSYTAVCMPAHRIGLGDWVEIHQRADDPGATIMEVVSAGMVQRVTAIRSDWVDFFIDSALLSFHLSIPREGARIPLPLLLERHESLGDHLRPAKPRPCKPHHGLCIGKTRPDCVHIRNAPAVYSVRVADRFVAQD